jgi:hypothetical protein
MNCYWKTWKFADYVACLLLLLLLLLLYDMDISCHRPFLPGTSLEPAVIPPLRLQASPCSTFRIMCGVPSILLILLIPP